MTRLAFLSTAHIHTKDFLTTLSEGKVDAEAHVIWDDVTDRGKEFSEAFGVPFNSDLGAVTSDEAVDGFVILSETTRHMPLLEAAMATGKPTFCEKPLAASADDAGRIRALSQKYGTPLIAGYFQPFFGTNRAVKSLLAKGELGDVTHASFRNAHGAAYGRWFDTDALKWFVDKELAGGGALMDMGTHAVHLLLHLFGPVTKVFAQVENLSGIYPNVDDYGSIQLVFESGVLGRVEAGWVQQAGPGGLEIFGSKKSIWRQGTELMIGAPRTSAVAIDAAEPRPDRMARLVAVIKGEVDVTELADDFDACLRAVEVMDAAYRAAESGRWEAP